MMSLRSICLSKPSRVAVKVPAKGAKFNSKRISTAVVRSADPSREGPESFFNQEDLKRADINAQENQRVEVEQPMEEVQREGLQGVASAQEGGQSQAQAQEDVRGEERKESSEQGQQDEKSTAHRDIINESNKILQPEMLSEEEGQERSKGPAGARPVPESQLKAWVDKEDVKLDDQNKDLDMPREEDIGSRI